MSNIPEARRRLLMMARYYAGTRTEKELLVIVAMLAREPAVRKAKPSSKRATPRLKTSIRLYAEENPTASLQSIADKFGVNAGRVSTALRENKS